MALWDPEHVRMKINPIQSIQTLNTGPNPGFLAGGGTNFPGGEPTYKFARFSPKLHEIKKILVRMGGMCRGRPSLDPPLQRLKANAQELLTDLPKKKPVVYRKS